MPPGVSTLKGPDSKGKIGSFKVDLEVNVLAASKSTATLAKFVSGIAVHVDVLIVVGPVVSGGAAPVIRVLVHAVVDVIVARTAQVSSPVTRPRSRSEDVRPLRSARLATVSEGTIAMADQTLSGLPQI